MQNFTLSVTAKGTVSLTVKKHIRSVEIEKINAMLDLHNANAKIVRHRQSNKWELQKFGALSPSLKQRSRTKEELKFDTKYTFRKDKPTKDRTKMTQKVSLDNLDHNVSTKEVRKSF